MAKYRIINVEIVRQTTVMEVKADSKEEAEKLCYIGDEISRNFEQIDLVSRTIEKQTAKIYLFK